MNCLDGAAYSADCNVLNIVKTGVQFTVFN
jgi:hypothetical protein